jgi:hypothetical protein
MGTGMGTNHSTMGCFDLRGCRGSLDRRASDAGMLMRRNMIPVALNAQAVPNRLRRAATRIEKTAPPIPAPE